MSAVLPRVGDRTGTAQAVVSVIIPCYNEASYIRRCLDSLLAGDFDHSRLEILVVDGLSTDGTRDVLAEYARRGAVIVVDNPGHSKPIALNRGIAAARGDVVMRIDAHALYPPDYVRRLVDGLFLFNADNIGGVRDTFPGSTPTERSVAAVISGTFGSGNAHWRTGTPGPRVVDTVFCGCYRRDVFARIGMFNERLSRAQDRELNRRLLEAGGLIVLDPGVRCMYFPRTTLGGYWRWNWNGAFWLFSARRFTDTRMLSWRNLVPPTFIAWHGVVALALLVTGPRWGAVAALPIVVYWLAVAVVSLRLAFRERMAALLVLHPLFLAMTHYGYGLAAWWGMIVAWGSSRAGVRQVATG